MRPALDHPLLLALAMLLPIAVIALVIGGYRRRRARLQRLGTPSMINRLVPPNAAVPPGWRATRLALAASLAGIAIAGPRWGIERTVVRGEGVDIVLAVDASSARVSVEVLHPVTSARPPMRASSERTRALRRGIGRRTTSRA